MKKIKKTVVKIENQKKKIKQLNKYEQIWLLVIIRNLYEYCIIGGYLHNYNNISIYI